MTIVREYRSEDRQQLHALAMRNYATLISGGLPAEASTDAAKAYFEHILQIQSGGRGFVFVAEEKTCLLGFVCLLVPVNPVEGAGDEEPYGFMSDLFVVPERRRQGIAGLLNAKVERQMGALGITQLALRVAADNSAAREFYRRQAYSEKFVVMSKKIRQ